ncbi:MAG: MerR family transcriptional regulator, partial [Dorea sp.]|nr:MerR family transcriptional regulator [Dorea sp.]
DVFEILWVDIHVSEKEEEHITELQIRVERQ